jgi:hypothetical protein
MLIEIAALAPPDSAKRKPAVVTTVSGRTFDAWPDVYGKLQIGRRYTIEVAEREFKNRTYYKITRVQPVDAPANGNVAPKIEAPQQPAPIGDAERAFVTAALGAFIQAGQVGADENELGRVTLMLRRVWRFAFVGVTQH